MFIELCSDACQTCSEMETTLNVSKAFKRIDICILFISVTQSIRLMLYTGHTRAVRSLDTPSRVMVFYIVDSH